jgi:hypothetical protein
MEDVIFNNGVVAYAPFVLKQARISERKVSEGQDIRALTL